MMPITITSSDTANHCKGVPLHGTENALTPFTRMSHPQTAYIDSRKVLTFIAGAYCTSSQSRRGPDRDKTVTTSLQR